MDGKAELDGRGGEMGGREVGSGWRSFSFVCEKLVTRREGTPAVILQWWEIRFWIWAGRGSVEGRMRSISHAMLRARRCSVEMCVGRMIQRITREITRGLRAVEESVERKVGRGEGVVGWRARRWSVQSGILSVGADV